MAAGDNLLIVSRSRLGVLGLIGPGTLWLALFFFVPMVFMGVVSLESGSIDEGVHGAADKFAGVFAAGGGQGDTPVLISVSGIGDLGAYAQVTSYLESLTLIRALSVDELAGDTVVYRAQVRGDAARLARAIELGNRLASTQGSSDSALSAALSYRYRP